MLTKAHPGAYRGFSSARNARFVAVNKWANLLRHGHSPSRWFILAIALLAAAPVLGEEPTLKTDDDKVLYAIGLSVARNLASYNKKVADAALGRQFDALLESSAGV